VVDAPGAILVILSNQGSLMGIERFAKRHRKSLIHYLGTHIHQSPSDYTFRLLLAQLDLERFEGVAAGLDQRPSQPCGTSRSSDPVSG
jgi:hypothetical protein